MFVFFKFSPVTRLSYRQDPRLTSHNFTCCHTETERGDHGFCLSQSHYIDYDTHLTSREQAPGARIESMTPDQNSQALLAELPPTWLHKKFLVRNIYVCHRLCWQEEDKNVTHIDYFLKENQGGQKEQSYGGKKNHRSLVFFEDQCNFDNCRSLFYSGNAELCKLKELRGSKKVLMIAPKPTRHGLID